MGQYCSQDTVLCVTRAGARGFNVWPIVFLAEPVKERRIEIWKNDPGTQEAGRHDGSAEATQGSSTHLRMIIGRCLVHFSSENQITQNHSGRSTGRVVSSLYIQQDADN